MQGLWPAIAGQDALAFHGRYRREDAGTICCRVKVDMYGSSPCQDFSLAGKGQGLSGARSGVFCPIAGQDSQPGHQAGFRTADHRLENVVGLVSRNSWR